MGLNLGNAGWRGTAAARQDHRADEDSARADKASSRADAESVSRLAADAQRLKQATAESEDYTTAAPARAAAREVAVGQAKEFSDNAPVRDAERRSRLMVADEVTQGAPVRAAQRANTWAEETVKAQKLKSENDRLAEEQGLQSEFSALQKEYDEQEGKRVGVRKQFMSSAAYAAHIALAGGDKTFAVEKMKKSNPYVVDFGIDEATGNLVIHEEHPETGATFDRQITKPEYMGLLAAGMPNVYGEKGRSTEAEDRALKQDTVKAGNAYRMGARPARELAPAEEIKALSSAAEKLIGTPAGDVLEKRIKELLGSSPEASEEPVAEPPEIEAERARLTKIAKQAGKPVEEYVAAGMKRFTPPAAKTGAPSAPELAELKKWAVAQASGNVEKAKQLFDAEYKRRFK